MFKRGLDYTDKDTIQRNLLQKISLNVGWWCWSGSASLECWLLIVGGSNARSHDITNSLGQGDSKYPDQSWLTVVWRMIRSCQGAQRGREGNNIQIMILFFQSSLCYFVFVIIILKGKIKNYSIECWLSDKYSSYVFHSGFMIYWGNCVFDTL